GSSRIGIAEREILISTRPMRHELLPEPGRYVDKLLSPGAFFGTGSLEIICGVALLVPRDISIREPPDHRQIARLFQYFPGINDERRPGFTGLVANHRIEPGEFAAGKRRDGKIPCPFHDFVDRRRERPVLPREHLFQLITKDSSDLNEVRAASLNCFLISPADIF